MKTQQATSGTSAATYYPHSRKQEKKLSDKTNQMERSEAVSAPLVDDRRLPEVEQRCQQVGVHRILASLEKNRSSLNYTVQV